MISWINFHIRNMLPKKTASTTVTVNPAIIPLGIPSKSPEPKDTAKMEAGIVFVSFFVNIHVNTPNKSVPIKSEVLGRAGIVMPKNKGIIFPFGIGAKRLQVHQKKAKIAAMRNVHLMMCFPIEESLLSVFTRSC